MICLGSECALVMGCSFAIVCDVSSHGLSTEEVAAPPPPQLEAGLSILGDLGSDRTFWLDELTMKRFYEAAVST